MRDLEQPVECQLVASPKRASAEADEPSTNTKYKTTQS